MWIRCDVSIYEYISIYLSTVPKYNFEEFQLQGSSREYFHFIFILLLHNF